MASQANCNQMQTLQQRLTIKKWFEIAEKSNIGISGDFNAILRRFLWRLPRADNSYEKKRAILWGLPMNSMHRWCKRKRLKSGGGAAILCKEDSSSNIFRARTFGWLDSNQPKPTQHWTCTMIFLAQPLAPTKTPKGRCRQSSSQSHNCLVLVGFLRFLSYPLLQPSYVFFFYFPPKLAWCCLLFWVSCSKWCALQCSSSQWRLLMAHLLARLNVGRIQKNPWNLAKSSEY